MSLLWRDEVTIALSPRRIALSRSARGVRPRVVAASEVAIPSGGGSEVAPVLARLSDVLADPTWHGAHARVVVADHPWVRYGIVPWPEARLDEPGRLTHARFILADAYGDAVADWSGAQADAPPGRSYVACAMPGTLPGTIREVLAPARLSLVTLKPRLVAAFEIWRHRIPADDAWFVCVDEGSLAAAHLSNGAWDRVHVTRPATEWQLELERLQAFDRTTRTARAPGRMLVEAPAWMRPAAAASPGIEWLEPSSVVRPPGLSVLRGIQP